LMKNQCGFDTCACLEKISCCPVERRVFYQGRMQWSFGFFLNDSLYLTFWIRLKPGLENQCLGQFLVE
jgi:hypothetical protein